MSHVKFITRPSRESHLLRGAVALLAMGVVAVAGNVLLPRAPGASEELTTEAGLSLIWTLWAVPVVALGAVVGGALIEAARAQPSRRVRTHKVPKGTRMAAGRELRLAA